MSPHGSARRKKALGSMEDMGGAIARIDDYPLKYESVTPFQKNAGKPGTAKAGTAG